MVSTSSTGHCSQFNCFLFWFHSEILISHFLCPFHSLSHFFFLLISHLHRGLKRRNSTQITIPHSFNPKCSFPRQFQQEFLSSYQLLFQVQQFSIFTFCSFFSIPFGCQENTGKEKKKKDDVLNHICDYL